MTTNIVVLQGDITRAVEVDAIITLINSAGVWFGGVDVAIMRVAGDHYHNQAENVLQVAGLHDGQVLIAEGEKTKHRGAFDHVIFVVDDLKQPLGKLVHSALNAAKTAGFKSVAMPLMRTGVMLGKVEPNVQAVLSQIKLGVNEFLSEGIPDMTIYIVVYGDPTAAKLLTESLSA